MCELFGMSSDREISAYRPLSLFQMRGGETADNPDGWGLATVEGDAFAIHKAPEAAARSVLFSKLAQQIHSRLIIAHVRRANPPTALTLENTHPFMRTCCGRPWVFAHNGNVPEVIAAQGCCHPRLSSPEGETDSEHAFIYLLEEIASAFPAQTTSPAMTEAWLENLALRSSAIAEYGQFNFLLSDGEHLIAYGHDRLYSQQRMEDGVQFVIIASVPLADDEPRQPWEIFKPGELRVYRGSQLLGRWSPEMTERSSRPIVSS